MKLAVHEKKTFFLLGILVKSYIYVKSGIPDMIPEKNVFLVIDPLTHMSITNSSFFINCWFDCIPWSWRVDDGSVVAHRSQFHVNLCRQFKTHVRNFSNRISNGAVMHFLYTLIIALSNLCFVNSLNCRNKYIYNNYI